jgi:hypothetical protein
MNIAVPQATVPAMREPVCEAVFAIFSAAYPWNNTPSRRLRMWDQVPPEERPAYFQFERGAETFDWKSNLVSPKRTFEIWEFFYIAASDENPGAPQVTAILDAIDWAMRPPVGPLGRLTLGGIAFQARIKSVPIKEPGDLNGTGIVVAQVEIVLP